MIGELGIDVSALLRPGVYILRRSGQVVWIGAAKVPLTRIHGHNDHRRGEPAPSWLPWKPVKFDSVELRPCLIDDLAAKLDEVRAELRWSEPVRHNVIDWRKALADA